MNQELKESLSQLPSKPGVYQFYDQNGALLYVGKAKDLAKRVNSYFQKRSTSPWTELLVSEIASLKTVEVNTELDALMLENSLIKSLRPKYNLQLKDDKTFPFLRVSKEDLPVFTITRRVKQDGARYFGPFFSATYLRSMLNLLQELYGIRTVSEKSYEARSSVPREIGLGARNLENRPLYAANVEKAIRFLSTPQPQTEKIIKEAMITAAAQHEFEQAAKLRDRLLALEQLRNTQSLFSPTGKNRDYLAFTKAGKLLSVYLLFERDGKIVNHKELLFEFFEQIDSPELVSMLLDYLYINGLPLPQEIMVPELPHDLDASLRNLEEQASRKVALSVPQRGESKTKLATALENARAQLQLESLKKTRRENGLSDLAAVFNLHKIPKRIEAFDISNLGATNIVGASIVFIDGKPAKGEYRKYKIETPEGQDDFASMRELVYRRVSNTTRPKPDLLLIDGGKGQLSAALDALALSKQNLPLIALAKKEELIYLPDRSDPITLAHDSDALLLLTAIRNEVHRYVISFHRYRRSKSMLR